MRMTYRKGHLRSSLPMLILLVMAGCSKPPDRDQRLVDLARESMKQQELQNEIIGKQSERVVAGSEKLAQAAQELVTKDAEARRELVQAQRELNGDLQRERSNIDRKKDAIDEERQELAAERVRAPVIAETIRAIGILAACLAPLVLVAYLFRLMIREEPDDRAVAELLLLELTADQPRLLPGPALMAPGLEHRIVPDSEPAETTDSGS